MGNIHNVCYCQLIFVCLVLEATHALLCHHGVLIVLDGFRQGQDNINDTQVVCERMYVRACVCVF